MRGNIELLRQPLAVAGGLVEHINEVAVVKKILSRCFVQFQVTVKNKSTKTSRKSGRFYCCLFDLQVLHQSGEACSAIQAILLFDIRFTHRTVLLLIS